MLTITLLTSLSDIVNVYPRHYDDSWNRLIVIIVEVVVIVVDVVIVIIIVVVKIPTRCILDTIFYSSAI